jgi:predicted DNA-binding ribbon-helix-helix protein
VTLPEIYQVKLGGRWTSVRIERQVMRALREIAHGWGIGVNDLCTEVACTRDEGSFASALRVFVVDHYRQLLRGRDLGADVPHTIERRTIPVGAADASEPLANLYRWWTDRRPAPGGVPSHADIDPGLLKRLGLRMVHVVDSTSDDPLGYRFRVFARQAAALLGREDLPGSRLGEYPNATYRSAVAEDYLGAVVQKAPRIQEVSCTVGGRSHRYQRLIAPFGPCGKADCLLVAVGSVEIGAAPERRAGAGVP